ncbi:hypothetical protein MKW98_008726 [Papaver atlanticum]|uniref:Uncharacterized protein n=1 Tax=Papaver atlanticum TaxID=357466 RepID=A0AAD4TEB2_9MAGN|nr:hypothetical protein MKW98_008726 [Papaver atlanticum]
MVSHLGFTWIFRKHRLSMFRKNFERLQEAPLRMKIMFNAEMIGCAALVALNEESCLNFHHCWKSLLETKRRSNHPIPKLRQQYGRFVGIQVLCSCWLIFFKPNTGNSHIFPWNCDVCSSFPLAEILGE